MQEEEEAWPCWPPAPCAAAPASAAPVSLRGRGRYSWMFQGSRSVTRGRRSSEGSPWVAGIPLPAGKPGPMSFGVWCSCEVA